MIKDVVTVPGNQTVMEAAKLMIEKNIGSLLVDLKGKFSVITKTDIIRQLALEESLANTPVKAILMNRELITCSPKDSLEDAMLKMAKNKIERLFVVDPATPKKIVGLISSSDLLRIAPGLLEIKREGLLLEEVGKQEESFSGYCDDCGNFVERLHNVGGFALCQECITVRNESSDTDDGDGDVEFEDQTM